MSASPVPAGMSGVRGLTFMARSFNCPGGRPIQGQMTFNLVALPVQSLGAGSSRQSDVARLVEALTVELAGEKIDLPSFPDVATRVRRALTNEEVDVEQVVRIVSAEPALAARLLQLANSAALNPNGKRLADLRAAVSRIGFNMARSAAIAFAMSQLRRAGAEIGTASCRD